MAKVCTELYPKGTFKGQISDGFYMDDTLKAQLDLLLKNLPNDWDFTIIITGGGEVRVGKSVLAMQIGAYWHYMIYKLYGNNNPFTVQNNFVFEGTKLIEFGNRLGKDYPGSNLIYDEAGADLDSKKVMQVMTQDVMDYFRECGQYNMLNTLVMPDYFDLPKGLAITRSIFLIDVNYRADEEGIFQRGYFNFYNRRNKKKLYIHGKKELDYNAATYSFRGEFNNFYPINEAEYRLAKQEALSKRESKRRNKFQTQRDAAWFLLTHEIGWKQEFLGQRMEQLTGIYVPQNTISDAIRHYKMENE